MGGYAMIDCDGIEVGTNKNEEVANSIRDAISVNKLIILNNLKITNAFGTFNLTPVTTSAYKDGNICVLSFHFSDSDSKDVVIRVENDEVVLTV